METVNLVKMWYSLQQLTLMREKKVRKDCNQSKLETQIDIDSFNLTFVLTQFQNKYDVYKKYFSLIMFVIVIYRSLL